MLFMIGNVFSEQSAEEKMVIKAEDFLLFLFSLQQKISIDEVLERFFIFFTDFEAGYASSC